MRIHIISIALASAVVLSSCGTLSLNDVKNFEQVEAYNLGENVNSRYDDYGADLFEDRLLFTSTRPTIEGYIYGEDFWFTDRQGKTWTRALNLGGSINTLLNEGSPDIIAGGEEIFFVIRGSEDGLGDEDIYSAQLDFNGKWQQIRNLGSGVNSPDWDSHPFLSPDGDELYFASDRPGGYGGTDIYVSKRTRAGRWGTARNLGPEINTSGDETSPMITPDGETLFFSSDGHPGLGGKDIFMAKKKDRGLRFNPPQNIGRPMNSRADDQYFRLSAQEDTIFISSNRSGGYGELDIWAFSPNPYKDTSRYIYWVTGMVYDTTSKYAIRNSTLTVKPATRKSFTMQLDNGRYRFQTGLNESYTMIGTAKNYFADSVTITVPSSLYYNEFRRNIGLVSEAVELPDSVKPPEATSENIVYFKFDKSVIEPASEQIIETIFSNKLKPMIDKDQLFDLVLSAYTCDLGTERYNIALSRRRGAAVSRRFRELGVPVGAVEMNAYGEVAPGPHVSEDERSHNRRVEIKVVPRMNAEE